MILNAAFLCAFVPLCLCVFDNAAIGIHSQLHEPRL